MNPLKRKEERKRKKLKREARRLALYIFKAGAVPAIPKRPTLKRVVVALREQYQSLLEASPERLRDAKRDARAAVRRDGLEGTVADLLPGKILRKRSNESIEKSRQLQARFYELHPDEAAPCPECRMKCGLPKRSWLSRELAEAALQRALLLERNARGIVLYQCPVNQNHWHLGHSS
jgi:hypothetical protein